VALTHRSGRTGVSGASLPIYLQGQISSLGLREDMGAPHKEPRGDARGPGERHHPEKGDSGREMGDLGVLFRG